MCGSCGREPITGNVQFAEEAVQEGFADALRFAGDWLADGPLRLGGGVW